MIEVRGVLGSGADSGELSKPDSVEAGAKIVASDWSEEERRNISAFFTLLDQWDRTMNPNRQVA